MTSGYKEAIENGFVGTEQDYNKLIEHSRITVLDDGSGFFVGNLPLPDDHWLLDERDDADPTPVLDPKYKKAIQRAVMIALRRCTRKGADMDLDPDALVQSVCYNLIGPNPIVKTKDI